MPGGADSHGVFASEALSRYSPPMNELVAESIVEAVRSSAAQPGGPFPKQAAAGRPPPVNLAHDVQGGHGGKVQRGHGNNQTLADRELKVFHDAGYTIKLHPPDYFLGCNVEPGPTHHQLNITMKAYVTQLAVKYLPKALTSYPQYHVPCTKELFSSYERALLREQKPTPELLKSYGSKVGAMIFAAPAARFECAYGIGICARCITFPTAEMDAHADRIIAYMGQHADDGIRFDGTAANASEFAFYSDSDWNVGHSTTGWCAMYGGGTVGYGSKRQHSVALSSTEAEIMAASLASCEAIFMRGLLREMGVAMDEPTVIRVDNQGAVALAKDRRSCHRSRHIQRRYLKIREWVALGEVRVEYVNTSLNPADILTKALERESFERHCATMGGGRAVRPAAFLGSVSDPMTAWASMYTATGLMYVEDDDAVAAPDTAATVAAVGDTGITGELWDAPSFALVRSLARAAGDAFHPGTFVTPFGLDEGPLLSAMPRTFENDDPSLREAAAMSGRDREECQQACDDEHDNLINHDAFEYVPEDSLSSWNPRTGRAREVCDTLWVLKQKRDGENKKTKKKGRICYNGAMQKATAAQGGRIIETFAPTVRHTTFKLLAAHGAVAGRRCRQFDVEGAYLKGKFEDGEIVYARPPSSF